MTQLEGGLYTKGLEEKRSLDDRPLVSIITVVLNGGNFIEKTINSVLGQSYDNVEYIIIDGGSTDNTLEIIEKYEDRVHYWLSEPDEGIADAFNKGILKSHGELVGIINSDDWYEYDTLSTVVLLFDNDADIICGDLRVWNTDNAYRDVVSDPSKLNCGMTVHHPAVFVRKRVYETYYPFNTHLKIAMDYDLLLRCYNSGVRFKHVCKILANMKSGGVSYYNPIGGCREVLKVKLDHGCPAWKAYPYFWSQVFRQMTGKFLKYVGFSVRPRCFGIRF